MGFGAVDYATGMIADKKKKTIFVAVCYGRSYGTRR